MKCVVCATAASILSSWRVAFGGNGTAVLSYCVARCDGSLVGVVVGLSVCCPAVYACVRREEWAVDVRPGYCRESYCIGT
jgi:hypothetical protein